MGNRNRYTLMEAIRAGASGCLIKNISGKKMVEYLNEFDSGTPPFSPGLESHLLEKIRGSYGQRDRAEAEKYRNLTCTQEEIMKYLARGYTYRKIGEEVHLSESTIKYHVKNIKEEYKLKTQAQVIAYFQDEFSENMSVSFSPCILILAAECQS